MWIARGPLGLYFVRDGVYAPVAQSTDPRAKALPTMPRRLPKWHALDV